MDAAERASEIRDQPIERQFERGAPADHHIVIPRPQRSRVGKPHNIAQSPPHPIALDRTPHFLRHRKSDPWRSCVGALAGLHDERRRIRPGSRRGCQEIRPFPQAFHGAGGRIGSGAQPLAAAGPAGIEHSAAALGRHAAPETVAALAHQFARLIGPLHRSVLRCPVAPIGRAPNAPHRGFQAKCVGFRVGAARGRAYTGGPGWRQCAPNQANSAFEPRP